MRESTSDKNKALEQEFRHKKAIQTPQALDVMARWKASGKRMMAIIENTPSGICITDEDGFFEYVNPSYCSIYGYKPEELIGKHFTIVVPEPDLAWLTELHDRYIAGHGEIRGEWPVRNKAGEELFVLADAVRIVDVDGRSKKVTFVVDITARKQAEEELARSERLLREAVATKDKFFSIIAHDLRNSFQTLIMSAEFLMLESDNISAVKTRSRAQAMFQASQSALALLENLLTWARSQMGAMQCQAVAVPLGELVTRAMEPLLSKVKAKGICMEAIIPEGLCVWADPDMLSTVLMNLLGNALKFSMRGDSVTVSVQEHSHHVTIAVSDTGIGMDPEMLDRLFDLTTHRTSLGTEGEQGTGLGLTLCREFVEKQGGKLWAESSLGKGATFSFTLPKCITSPRTPRAEGQTLPSRYV